MARKNRDRTTGLPLPSPVVPASTICIKIPVPNALEYRAALKGVLSELGKAWTWSQKVGEDNSDAFTAAELWREAIAQAVYQLDCECDDMSCEDVAVCIDTNEAVQDAISNQIVNNSSIQQIINQYAEKGVPMTAGTRGTIVTGVTDCDLNSVFGSVTAIIDALDTNNRDFIEIVQITDVQAKKISKAISAIPLLGLLPIDELVSFVGDTAPALKVAYESEYTTEYRDTLRCALFCVARDKADCALTFQDIIEIFNDRIGTAMEPINFFVELMEFIVAGTWPGTVAIDVLTLIQLAAWQQGSEWMGVTLRTLQTVGLLGANDDDPDWSILCEDCTGEVGFVVRGNVGTTTVVRSGNVYTITGGYTGPGGNTFIYVQSSIDGVTGTVGTFMSYDSLSISGLTGYDWGDDSGAYGSTPPSSAPPPNVYYAGGSRSGGPNSAVSIVIETTLPFQGVLQGT